MCECLSEDSIQIKCMNKPIIPPKIRRKKTRNYTIDVEYYHFCSVVNSLIMIFTGRV